MRLITINWKKWLDKITENPGKVIEFIDEALEFKVHKDQAEQTALLNVINKYSQEVLFIEEGERKICTFKYRGDYFFRLCDPSIDEEAITRFITYTLTTARLLVEKPKKGRNLTYISLDPLVYSGEYWLNTVCRQEMARTDEENETTWFSILLMPLPDKELIEGVIANLRLGDRIGLIDSHLVIVLPFADTMEGRAVCRRLKERFHLHKFQLWQYGKSFTNMYEIKTLVKKSI